MTVADFSRKLRRLVPTIVGVLLITGLTLIVSGCSSPVGVKHVDIETAYSLNNESALSAGEASEISKMVLRRHGLLDRFETEPAMMLAELHSGQKPADDEDYLIVLADLSLLHAERTGDRAYFLASAVYAWALLFPGDSASNQLQPSDPRFRLTYDLYNHGLAKGLAAPGDDDEEV